MDLAEKANTKKKNEKKKTKKPCHRRTNRTYLYAGVPQVEGRQVEIRRVTQKL